MYRAQIRIGRRGLFPHPFSKGLESGTSFKCWRDDRSVAGKGVPGSTVVDDDYFQYSAEVNKKGVKCIVRLRDRR